jgi:hypothetical protein
MHEFLAIVTHACTYAPPRPWKKLLIMGRSMLPMASISQASWPCSLISDHVAHGGGHQPRILPACRGSELSRSSGVGACFSLDTHRRLEY